MRTRSFGLGGVQVPVIGQGTWNFPEGGTRRTQAVAALRRGIELGMTHIDTAEMYGGGRVEEILGDALSSLPREALFVTSKVLPGNASYAGTIAACDATLRRMRLDYLDCFLLHWPGDHPLEATMRALEDLVERGKARFIGVSNFDLPELREARSYLQKIPLSCNEVLYHVRERGIERRLLPYCAAESIALVGYTPFGRGRFPRESAAAGAIAAIARARGVTSRQVILGFLTRTAPLFAIPKASSIEHVEENAGAGDLVLDAAEIAAIDAAYPIGDDGPLASL
ncbi:MAG TPA: aldo/keto reductase [Verrucomicrobiae bacterium]|jgi:diketogulonate reductase-like aldo/keto reductase|nr:aldo/keto reductase [Verrucomicrobiae bacterium]